MISAIQWLGGMRPERFQPFYDITAASVPANHCSSPDLDWSIIDTFLGVLSCIKCKYIERFMKVYK
jgi:hypothetical protein